MSTPQDFAEYVAELLKDADVGFPYSGAKPHYILDIDDSTMSNEVVRILEPITTLPKTKKKKEIIK